MQELQDTADAELAQQVLGSLVRKRTFTLSESENTKVDVGSEWKVYELTSEVETATCVGFQTSKIMEVVNLTHRLVEEKAMRAEQLRELGAQIAGLWTKLEVPEEERESFRNSVNVRGNN